MLTTQLLPSTRTPNVAQFYQQEKIHFCPEYFLIWTLITVLSWVSNNQDHPITAELYKHSLSMHSILWMRLFLQCTTLSTSYQAWQISVRSCSYKRQTTCYLLATASMLSRLGVARQHLVPVLRRCLATSHWLQWSNRVAATLARLFVWTLTWRRSAKTRHTNVALVQLLTFIFFMSPQCTFNYTFCLFVCFCLSSFWIRIPGWAQKNTHTYIHTYIHTCLASCLLPQLAPLKVLLYSAAY